MWRRSLKILLGLLLAPLTAVTIQTLAGLVADLMQTRRARAAVVALAAGTVLGALGRAAQRGTTRFEILLHELTHVLWTWLFGGRASKLRVNRRGGSVRVTRDNIWVSLAPYFFPLTTIAVLAAWGVVRLVLDSTGPRELWFALIGASWGAHAVAVAELLRIPQPDVEQHGTLCSLMMILAANLFGVGLTLAIVGNFGAGDWCLRWLRTLLIAIRALIAWRGLG